MITCPRLAAWLLGTFVLAACGDRSGLQIGSGTSSGSGGSGGGGSPSHDSYFADICDVNVLDVGGSKCPTSPGEPGNGAGIEFDGMTEISAPLTFNVGLDHEVSGFRYVSTDEDPISVYVVSGVLSFDTSVVQGDETVSVTGSYDLTVTDGTTAQGTFSAAACNTTYCGE